EILKMLTAGQPCDITGIEDYEMLERRGGIQWPYSVTHADDRTERRLFENAVFFHPDGRARLVADPPRPFPEQPSQLYPFVLLTGRGTASQWHTQSRTQKSAVLRKLSALEPYVELNPQDATRLGIRSGDLVAVASQRGRMSCRAVVSPSVLPGQLFIPMHFEGTNLLTH